MRSKRSQLLASLGNKITKSHFNRKKLGMVVLACQPRHCRKQKWRVVIQANPGQKSKPLFQK
jgi:hypothetical protein